MPVRLLNSLLQGDLEKTGVVMERFLINSTLGVYGLADIADVEFGIEAVNEAIVRYGCPEIMNTDQGSQFTSQAFTGLLKDNGIPISMDGKGAWRDNVFIERLWRTIKYEHVYLHAYESVSQARLQIADYIRFYNQRRPHSTLDGLPPDQVYFPSLNALEAA